MCCNRALLRACTLVFTAKRASNKLGASSIRSVSMTDPIVRSGLHRAWGVVLGVRGRGIIVYRVLGLTGWECAVFPEAWTVLINGEFGGLSDGPAHGLGSGFGVDHGEDGCGIEAKLEQGAGGVEEWLARVREDVFVVAAIGCEHPGHEIAVAISGLCDVKDDLGHLRCQVDLRFHQAARRVSQWLGKQA